MFISKSWNLHVRNSERWTPCPIFPRSTCPIVLPCAEEEQVCVCACVHFRYHALSCSRSQVLTARSHRHLSQKSYCIIVFSGEMLHLRSRRKYGIRLTSWNRNVLLKLKRPTPWQLDPLNRNVDYRDWNRFLAGIETSTMWIDWVFWCSLNVQCCDWTSLIETSSAMNWLDFLLQSKRPIPWPNYIFCCNWNVQYRGE